MKVTEMYPDKWLKAEHLQGRTITLYVQDAAVQKVFNTRTKKEEAKFVLYFYKAKLPMILNKTQTMSMVRVTGADDSDMWKGHYVALSPAIAPNGEATITISKPETKHKAQAAPEDDIEQEAREASQ